MFAAVPLAAFLSFSVQPLMGKFLVPWHGGSASTWVGAMVYFQIALLLGYLWAAWWLRRSLAAQVRATVGLAGGAMLATWLPPPRLGLPVGLVEVIGSLAVASLPAMVLCFSTSLLLHGWLRRHEQEVPYHLYAISNLGSLGGLAAYPFLIERFSPLGVQAWAWRGLLVLLGGLLIAVALHLRRHPGAEPPSGELAREPLPPGRAWGWFGLSALAVVGMIATTQQLSAEIGSNPLSWLLPLGLYLGGFALTFTGWWPPVMTQLATAALAVCLGGYTLTKGVGAGVVAGWTALWLVGLTAFTGLSAHGQLYATRPRRDFTRFYLLIALGGLSGGLFATVVAPLLFARHLELIGSATLVLALGLVALVAERPRVVRVAILALICLPVAFQVHRQISRESDASTQVIPRRNLYGRIDLTLQPWRITLSHETTIHGVQLIESPAARRRPTLYYTESTPIGIAISELQLARETVEIGVIGLGAGTVATYAREGDGMVFWDIDPKVFEVANEAFTFLRDSEGDITLVQADGRQGLAAWRGQFDLILVDAFSGDSVPPHLLTEQALALYFDRLVPEGGLVLIHASNRYADLFPVIAAGARRLGYEALSVTTDILHATAERDAVPSSTTYILLHRPDWADRVEDWFPFVEDHDNRVLRRLRRLHPEDEPPRWTDDRHSILDVLRIRDVFKRK